MRPRLQIPLKARFKSWFHPLAGSEKISREAFSKVLSDKNDDVTLKALVAVGMFVYFDKDHNIIQANALDVGSGMGFDGPFPLAAGGRIGTRINYTDYVAQLIHANRFDPVTLPSLFDIGIKWFAWIQPGEVITTPSSTLTWCPGGTRRGGHGGGLGCFVYLGCDDIKECARMKVRTGLGAHEPHTTAGTCQTGRQTATLCSAPSSRRWILRPSR